MAIRANKFRSPTTRVFSVTTTWIVLTPAWTVIDLSAFATTNPFQLWKVCRGGETLAASTTGRDRRRSGARLTTSTRTASKKMATEHVLPPLRMKSYLWACCPRLDTITGVRMSPRIAARPPTTKCAARPRPAWALGSMMSVMGEFDRKKLSRWRGLPNDRLPSYDIVVCFRHAIHAERRCFERELCHLERPSNQVRHDDFLGAETHEDTQEGAPV